MENALQIRVASRGDCISICVVSGNMVEILARIPVTRRRGVVPKSKEAASVVRNVSWESEIDSVFSPGQADLVWARRFQFKSTSEWVLAN